MTCPKTLKAVPIIKVFFRDLRASIRWNPGGELAFATAQDHEWASSACGSLHARHQSSRE
jgi:hypothetical protein